MDQAIASLLIESGDDFFAVMADGKLGFVAVAPGFFSADHVGKNTIFQIFLVIASECFLKHFFLFLELFRVG